MKSRYHSAEGDIALFSVNDEDDVEVALLGSTDKENKSPALSRAQPVWSLLTRPVILAVLNYGLLAILEISLQVLLPIFLATSLHFAPSSIGLVMGIMGIVNGVVQLSLFVPLHNRFGSRNLFTLGLCSLGAIFATFPFILRAYTENGERLGFTVYALITLQMVLCPIEQMSFSKSDNDTLCTLANTALPDVIFLYVQASSPTKETLGVINGISQTVASIARAIGPASATSLYALSMQRQDISGGYLVYYVLGVLSLISMGISRKLPSEPWRRNGKNES